MQVKAALTKEQGVTFAVVLVKETAVQPSTRDETRAAMQTLFPGVPTVLMCQDWHGVPSYYGRPDLTGFLSNIDFRRLPWKAYAT